MTGLGRTDLDRTGWSVARGCGRVHRVFKLRHGGPNAPSNLVICFGQPENVHSRAGTHQQPNAHLSICDDASGERRTVAF